MKLSIDFSLLFKDNIGPNGLEKAQLEASDQIPAFTEVTQNVLEKKYSFLTLLEDPDLLKTAQSAYESIRWAKTLIIIGIGGSDLGGRMLQQALQPDEPPMKVQFIGDTTDPEAYRQLFLTIKPEETVVNVISKSGETTETAVGYLLLKSLFHKQVGDQWPKHFIFTTKRTESMLASEADRHHIPTLKIPETVGGRYSVLSIVGLLPALAMGIDVEALLKGTSHMIQELSQTAMLSNAAWSLALAQYLFQTQHQIHSVVLMPYVLRLEFLANWFRQLWAESLGKNGKGILPIKAMGPTDQHSQLQYYNEGLWLHSFIFINCRHYNSELVLDNLGVPELVHLNNLPVEDVIQNECEATRFSLANHGRPSVLITLDRLDAAHLGALIGLFELSVVYLGALLGVNVFDQPGVEESKDYMYGLLSKAGYHDKAEEILHKRERLVKQVVSYSF